MLHNPRAIETVYSPCNESEKIVNIEDGLYLPKKSSFTVPLLVRVTGGEDVSKERKALTESGWAVYLLTMDQASIEQDLSACEKKKEELLEKIEKLLAENNFLDRKRVYLDGWFTAYVIFHTDFFRAAIARPALVNRTTAYGLCPAGEPTMNSGTLYEEMISLAEGSVLIDVDNCKTPCLVFYREGNPRYSREQSEELYSAMKDRNPEIPCRMAVFTPKQWEKYEIDELMTWLKRFDTEGENNA